MPIGLNVVSSIRFRRDPDERQLLAMLIVGVGALVLILCVALLMLFADQPAGPPAQSRFPIPAYLFSFAALRDTRLGRVVINRDW